MIAALLCAGVAAAAPLESRTVSLDLTDGRIAAVSNRITGENYAAVDPDPFATLPAMDELTDVTLAVDGDAVTATATARKGEGLLTESRIVVGPFGLDEVRLIIPAMGGIEIDGDCKPWREDYAYSAWGLEAPMVLVQGAAGGVLIYADDASYPFVSIEAQRAAGVVSFALRRQADPPWEEVIEIAGPTWRFLGYEGEWQVGAGIYREALRRSERQPPNSPAWGARITRVAELAGDVDIDALRRFAQVADPPRAVLYYPHWRELPYDVDYPDFTPSAHARELIPAAREMGFRVMVHGNLLGIGPRHELYPQYERFAERYPQNGNIVGWMLGSGAPTEIVMLNPAFPEVRRLFVDAYAAAYADTPFDAIHLDYPAFNNSLPGPVGGINPARGAELLVREIREALPEVALSVEAQSHNLLGASFVQSGAAAMDNMDAKHGDHHPVSSFIFQDYSQTYHHLAVPTQVGTHWDRRAWFTFQGVHDCIGALPGLTIHKALNADEPGTRMALADATQIVEGAATSNEPIPHWRAWRNGTAFGLWPEHVYLPEGDAGRSGFGLTDCSEPVRVTAGENAQRAFARLKPAPEIVVDLLRQPPVFFIRVDGAELAIGHGAQVAPASAICGGDERDAILVHPPWQFDEGATPEAETVLRWRLRLPDRQPLWLRLATGLRDLPARQRGEAPGDGIRATVRVDGDRLAQWQHASRRWADRDVDLAAFAGQTVELELSVDPGELGDAGYDWAAIAEPRIVVGLPRADPISATIQTDREPVAVIEGIDPWTLIHAYEVADVGGPVSLIDLPFTTNISVGGRVVEHSVWGAGMVDEFEIGGRSIRGISAHPPWQGETRLDWVLKLPREPVKLAFSCGLRDGGKQASMGVEINGQSAWRERFDAPKGWVDGEVNIHGRGDTVLVSLVTDSLGNSGWDWAVWGEPKLEWAG